MYTVSLASRSFQVINRVTDSIKRSGKSSAKLSSVKNGKPASASTTMKKEASSRVRLHENKSSVTTNGRYWFESLITLYRDRWDLFSYSMKFFISILLEGNSSMRESLPLLLSRLDFSFCTKLSIYVLIFFSSSCCSLALHNLVEGKN